MLPELVQFTALSARNVPVMPDAIVILLAVVRVPLVTPMVEFEFIETAAVPRAPLLPRLTVPPLMAVAVVERALDAFKFITPEPF
jgi:hypothetical protein